MPDADLDQGRRCADRRWGLMVLAGDAALAISVAVPLCGADGKPPDRLIEKLCHHRSEKSALYFGQGRPITVPVVTRGCQATSNGWVANLRCDQGATLGRRRRDFKLQGMKPLLCLRHLLVTMSPRQEHLQAEIFGQFCSTVRQRPYEEALGLAMDHEMGNRQPRSLPADGDCGP